MMARVTKDLGPSETPAAARASTSPWRDPRLWTGIALVAGSIVVGAQVFAAADDTTQVWSARRDLGVGTEVAREDLVPLEVRLSDRVLRRYLAPGDDLPAGGRLSRPVGAGELVAASAFGETGPGLVAVPVAVPAGAVPASLVTGSVVDVWVTAGDRGEPAVPALEDVVVLEAPEVDDVLGGSGERRLVVGVPAGHDGGVGSVLAAGRDGRLSLTVEG